MPEAGKGFSLEDSDPQRERLLTFSLSELSLRPFIISVGVLIPEVGGLWEGVEVMPLMSMAREERGVSMVDGMVEIGGDFDFPLEVETSATVCREETLIDHSATN